MLQGMEIVSLEEGHAATILRGQTTEKPDTKLDDIQRVGSWEQGA